MESRSSKRPKPSSILILKVVDASRNDEVRDAVIGMDTRWNLLFVVHIEVEDEAIRLISARRATRQERTAYEA